jgi:hypothetical protein
MYLAVAAGVTALVALGITLLLRGDVDRSAQAELPRWSRAREAARVAAGGVASVQSMPKNSEPKHDKPSEEEPESESK